ncbi:MAG: phospho-N-acetylmuramoyl-pentapeptide-transferase, partial [Faecalibacterium sp.]|nr:phospho-N-acetylmuramoyl-pentapeptide-transferase [Faecalibacterium sp.]
MVAYLNTLLGSARVGMLAFLLCFVLVTLLTRLLKDKLPQDQGRQYAVNGQLSKGKARGSGVIFVPCVALVSLAFMPFSIELAAYMALLVAAMLSGYLDDASDKPWSEYKKGLIDLVLAVLTGLTFLNF